MIKSIPVWSGILTHFFFFGVIKCTSLILPIFIKDVLDFNVTEVSKRLQFLLSGYSQ